MLPAHAGDGLYVWGPAVEMTDGRGKGRVDQAEQHRLLEFCRARGIVRLYLLADPESWDAASLGALLHRAKSLGIDAYAVPPAAVQDAWVRPLRFLRRCDHGVVVRWAEAVRRQGGFAGVQLDLEPHDARSGLVLWGNRTGRTLWRYGTGGLLRDPRNRRLASEFLSLLDRLRERLEPSSGGLRVAVTLPTWFDRDDAQESYRFEYGGAVRVLAHHVQDRADFVTLMNYLDGSTPESLERGWRDISGEVAYGPVESLFETAPPGPGTASPRPEQTLFEEGEARYLMLRAWLEGWYAGHPNFLGCGAHHYREAYGAGLPGWPGS